MQIVRGLFVKEIMADSGPNNRRNHEIYGQSIRQLDSLPTQTENRFGKKLFGYFELFGPAGRQRNQHSGIPAGLGPDPPGYPQLKHQRPQWGPSPAIWAQDAGQLEREPYLAVRLGLSLFAQRGLSRPAAPLAG